MNDRPSFFRELSRRNVFRVVIVYLSVAWILLQFSEIAFPRLGLPDWGVTLLLAFLAIGLPIVIVAAWAYDLQPQSSTTKTAEALEANDQAIANKSRFIIGLELVTIVVLAIAVAYLYITRPSDPGQPTPIDQDAYQSVDHGTAETLLQSQDNSIAVLPFVNMSDDPANEYFSDGVSEELLDALAKLGTIRVAARTSSFSFKNKNTDIREIGKQLNVATVLEGSVRKAGDKVRITSQLINAEDGYHLWSETYDRKLTDIFSVQDEIAKSIVEALHVPLGLAPEASIVKVGTENVEAYSAYLRGLHFSKLLSRKNNEASIVHLKEAIRLDSNYPAPHGTLANAYSMASLWQPREKVLPLSFASAERALELDPKMGIALVTKAEYLTITEWNWEASQALYEKGLQDSSERTWATVSYVTIHLMPLGQLAQARVLLNEAELLDPLDSRLKLVSGTLYLYAGEISRAIETLEATITLDPENVQGAAALCGVSMLTANIERALEIIEYWTQPNGRTHPWLLPCKAFSQLAAMELVLAEASFLELQLAADKQSGLAFMAGDLAATMGKTEIAIDWFERALAEGELTMLMVRNHFSARKDVFDHPRFQKILRKMRLDDSSVRDMGY